MRMLAGLKSLSPRRTSTASTKTFGAEASKALVCTQAELKFKSMVDREWAELAYKGLWFDPLKEDLEAFIESIQKRVTGSVWVRLGKGACTVVGRSSDWALYNEELASFD